VSDVEKLLLTPEEAAEALSVGRTKVYQLIGEGTLRSVRIGKCRRVPTSALVELVEELTGSVDQGGIGATTVATSTYP
jgi:excisionase family DNA binding protein